MIETWKAILVSIERACKNKKINKKNLQDRLLFMENKKNMKDISSFEVVGGVS